MINLVNKKILYIAPKFFGYEENIADQLVKLGADIDFLPDRLFDTPLMTAVTKVKREWIIPSINKAYREKLNEFSRTHYDVIFVVNGQTLSEEFLSELKQQYKQATFILYMWDSLKNRESTIKNLDFFDHCFSFDKNDATEFSMNFRPLFFSNGFEKSKSNILNQHDISFIGTAHTDRYHIVKSITDSLPSSTKKYWYLFLQAPWVFYYYKLTNSYYKKANRDEFKYSSITKKEVQDVFFSSRSILDIEHPNQTGLTIRTLETLGSEKKLVTTNKNVKNYDFYVENNIFVIDRKNPVVPTEFINSPYTAICEKTYQKYSIQGWLDEILLKSKIKDSKCSS
ncbi:hypothetical protein [Thiothrix subterranea]|uniref:Capsular biosynthesis protein CpsH n=1 Tax=Thiothrix subterranea TaxID=2735563 RepID=A0ABU0Y430_9GAMM|nr:hypothetical protein [Thiothrix subterranea]MDQ5767551.1 hypothetical protein [Thiothrix subterranea]